jgi:uncharacterized repeat protein (TIGR02543 family)
MFLLRKNLWYGSILILGVVAMLGLTGCPSPSGSDTTYYTVTFDSGGGGSVQSQSVARGAKAAAPSPAPTRPGYVLEGWYKEATYDTRWDFTVDTVAEHTTLYAKWVETTAADQNKAALQEAGEIILTAKDSGGNDVELAVTVGDETITIVIGGETVNYPSGITDSTIILKGAGSGGTDVSLGYVINDDGTLTITGLDQIDGANLAEGSVTSDPNDGLTKPDISFLVSFDAQDGSPTPERQTVASGGKAVRPTPDPAPPEAGYTFGGWYTEAEGTNAWDFDVNTVTANITLYAKWTPGTSFTVSFNAQGGTPTPGSQTVLSGAKATTPSPVPAKEGYTLDGWYTEAAGTTRWNFDNAVTGAITLHAKWTPVAAGSFVVTFDSVGGSEVDAQIVASGAQATAPSPAPVKADHTFDGWHTDAAYATVYDFNAPVTKDIILYAKWTEIVKYTVTFNAHEGTPVPAAQNVASGAKVAGPSPAPVKDGYDLEGWYKEEAYTTIWNFDTDTVTEAITLHAKWTEVAAGSFVVTFDSVGGSEVANQIVTSGAQAMAPSEDPVKAGHTFSGWYTEETYVTVYDFGAPVTEDITLYARWTANEAPTSYAVTFDAHGGEPVPTAQNVVSGEKAAAPSPVPAREGYTLAGWYREQTYVGTKWDFAVDTVTAIITLHAKWEAVERDSFVVTFDSRQGSQVAPQNVESGGTAVEPDEPTRDGFDFEGWYTGAGGDATAYDFGAPVTENITLYAKWTETFVPVTGIVSRIPANATTDEAINLNAQTDVNPSNATNKNILWTLSEATDTGVTNEDLADGIFTAPNGGTLSLIATIVDGTAAGTNFVKGDISIVIVKPVTDITGVSLAGSKGFVINLSGATVVPGDATNRDIVWSVKASDVAGITTESAAPFTPAGTGSVTLVATIANGRAMELDYVKEFSITIYEPGVYSPEVGFGDATSLSVSGNVPYPYVEIKSGDQREVTVSNYYITLWNASEYTNITWYINGTKSTVTGSRLTLDTSKKGLVQITVEAYKEGSIMDTGTFRFDVQ